MQSLVYATAAAFEEAVTLAAVLEKAAAELVNG
jgi:hypothetical protein